MTCCELFEDEGIHSDECQNFDGAPCCPVHSSNLGNACDFPGYAANH